MLAPLSWQKTSRNLHAALTSSIAAKDFWARSRNLRYLRFVHRLDADTTGVLLLAKSPGAVQIGLPFLESNRHRSPVKFGKGEAREVLVISPFLVPENADGDRLA